MVSVVIPCYNDGPYLKEAIESTLDQTYSPIEIIVVDDGSTDNSAEIASRYPVTLITQNNQGTGAALNHGIRHASGEDLIPLGADDKLHPSFVDRCVRVLQEHPEVAFVYTSVILFGDRGGVFYSKPYELGRLKLGNFIPGIALIRAQAIRAAGGFDANLPCLEDWDLWLSLAERGLFGRLLPEPLLYVRQHKDPRRNAPSPIARATVRKIMLKHPSLFPRLYLVEDRLEKKAERVLPTFVKRILRRISPRAYPTWNSV